ncbi:MAG: hypothetical protein RJQ09_09065 [Cyclobacteriaceae bacterium]
MKFKYLTIVISLIGTINCLGQSTGALKLKGEYSAADSAQITESYYRAHEAAHNLLEVADRIWNVNPDKGQSKRELRKLNWEKEEEFSYWLGEPVKIAMVRRVIRRIHKKFRRNIILIASREDRGVCNRWTGAWAIPLGKIRIRLCENFFNSTHLQEKIILHELGHEAGMLWHRGIHNCFTASREAQSGNQKVKRSPENYAWLAMSYLGLQCSY